MNLSIILSIAIIYWGALIFFFFSETKKKRIVIAVLTAICVTLAQEKIGDSISAAADSISAVADNFHNWVVKPCLNIYSHNIIIYSLDPGMIFLWTVGILIGIPLIVLILILQARAKNKKSEEKVKEVSPCDENIS
jgi:hypothetical protein